MGAGVGLRGHLDDLSFQRLVRLHQERLAVDEDGVQQFALILFARIGGVLLIVVEHQHLAGLGEVHAGDRIGLVVDLVHGDGPGAFRSQKHVRPPERELLIVGIALAVEQVVLEHLHVVVILRIVLHVLMEVEHDALMDIEVVKDLRHHLIGGDVLPLVLQSDVVPDKVVRLIDGTSVEVSVTQAQSGQMVSVEEDHGGLVPGFHALNELFDEGILLIQLIDVVLPLPVGLVRGGTGDVDGGFLDGLLHGKCAVGLNGHHEHEVPAGTGDIQRIVDGSHQVAVPHPSAFVYVVLRIHVLLRDEAEIAQTGENGTAGVEVGLVVVDGGGPVAQSIELIGGAVAHPFGQNGLVGKLAGAEIAQAHAGLHGKLRVDGPGSHHRHLKVSGSVFLRQFVPVGQRILVEVQPVHTGGIEEGLQLHHDDVGLDLHVGGAVIDLVHQFLHRFLGIAVGLADARIQHRHGKAVRESVFLVTVGQVVKVIGEDIGSQQQDRQSVKRGKGH